MFYDIVISINVHHRPKFLLQLLDNIERFVKCKYLVVLNCNRHMHAQLLQFSLAPNVMVHPTPIEKRRFHGSLTHGIVANMQFAIQRTAFGHFLVMSLRSRFYRELTPDSNIQDLTEFRNGRHTEYDRTSWHWPKFRKSMLFAAFEQKHLPLCRSPHEGVCFPYSACIALLTFFHSNPNIMRNTLQYPWCMEEFALQTIAPEFYYLGNGVYTKTPSQCAPDKFIHKIDDD